MSEKEARAVGAGSGMVVMIGGKECSPRPLGLRELAEVERDCLDRHKRDYLRTYSDNLDLLPEGDRKQLMEQKLDQVARWDTKDLPIKQAYISTDVVLTDNLREWVRAELRADESTTDLQYQLLVALALDQDILTIEKYKKLSGGSDIARVRMDYVSWWSTGSFDGMITFLWKAFRKHGVTREQVIEDVGSDLGRMTELSREIENLSRPAVGNG